MNKKILLIGFLILVLSSFAYADDIASCELFTNSGTFVINDNYQTFSLNDTYSVNYIEIHARNTELFNTILTINIYENSTNELKFTEQKTINDRFTIYEFAKGKSLILGEATYRIEFSGINSIDFLSATESVLGSDCYSDGSVYTSTGTDLNEDLLFRIVGSVGEKDLLNIYTNERETDQFVQQYYDYWWLESFVYLPFDGYLKDSSFFSKSVFLDQNIYNAYDIYIERLNSTCSDDISNSSLFENCWDDVYFFDHTSTDLILRQSESYTGNINADVGYLYNFTLNMSDGNYLNYPLTGGDYYRIRWNIKYAGGNFNNGFYLIDDLTDNPTNPYFIGSGIYNDNSNSHTFSDGIGYYSDLNMEIFNLCSGRFCNVSEIEFPTNETETPKGELGLTEDEISKTIGIFERAGTDEEGNTNQLTIIGFLGSLVLIIGIVFMFYSFNDSTFFLGVILFKSIVFCVIIGILPLIIPIIILMFMVVGFLISLLMGFKRNNNE